MLPFIDHGFSVKSSNFFLAILKTFSKVFFFLFSCSKIYNFTFNSMTYFELILYKMWSLCCSGFLLSLFLPPECGIPECDPWVGKIPWRRERLPTSVFWPEEFHGQYQSWGHKQPDTTERLSHSGHVHLFQCHVVKTLLLFPLSSFYTFVKN